MIHSLFTYCSRFRPAQICILIFMMTACVSPKSMDFDPETLKKQLILLNKNCQLSKRSGFTADLSISNQGSTRIEANWDSEGNLNGQLINTLGEDLLNFRINPAGYLETDAVIYERMELGSTLEFLAELGSSRTRLLLCSGLFLKDFDHPSKQPNSESHNSHFGIKNGSMEWLIDSSIRPRAEQANETKNQLRISTEVSTRNFLFKKSVAKIDWLGITKNQRLSPERLTIQTLRSAIILSFLEFE